MSTRLLLGDYEDRQTSTRGRGGDTRVTREDARQLLDGVSAASTDLPATLSRAREPASDATAQLAATA